MSLLSWHDIWTILLTLFVINALWVSAVAVGRTHRVDGPRERFWRRREEQRQRLMVKARDSFMVRTIMMEPLLNHRSVRAMILAQFDALTESILDRRLHRFIRPHYNDCPCTHCLHNTYWRTITGE